MLTLTKTQRVHLASSKRALRVCLLAAMESLGDFDSQAFVTLKKQIEWHKSLRPFVEHIANDLLESSSFICASHEIPINDAGFKMYVHIEKNGRLKAYMHGDQRWNHPVAYRYLTAMFKFYGLLPDDRDPIDLP
ncbi:MAG TPA: hypothetical protein VF837_04570 [Patescibacteria group bacterium]